MGKWCSLKTDVGHATPRGPFFEDLLIAVKWWWLAGFSATLRRFLAAGSKLWFITLVSILSSELWSFVLINHSNELKSLLVTVTQSIWIFDNQRADWVLRTNILWTTKTFTTSVLTACLPKLNWVTWMNQPSLSETLEKGKRKSGEGGGGRYRPLNWYQLRLLLQSSLRFVQKNFQTNEPLIKTTDDP